MKTYSRIRQVSETPHKRNPEAGFWIWSRPRIELAEIRFSRWNIVRLDVRDMMIEFVVVFGVFLERLEGDTFRTIKASFHNDEKSAHEEKSREAGQDIVEQTPRARIEHVSRRDRGETSETKRGRIIPDLCASFMEEETIIHNLKIRIKYGGNRDLP